MFRIRDPQESLWQSQFLVTPKKAKRLERSWAEVFRNEALPLIDEERFAPMYCVDNGRPNRAVQTVLGVHLLKEMFNLTDDEALEQLEFNPSASSGQALLWHHALRLDIEETHLPQKTLHNFRVRLMQHDGGRLAFQETTDRIIQALGIRTGKQRLDSTHIMSNIATLTRLGLFCETMRLFLRALRWEHPELRPGVPEGLLGRYLKEEDEATHYEDARTGEGRRRLSVCARDLYRLVDRFHGTTAAQLEEYRLLERLLREQCHVGKHQDGRPGGDDDDAGECKVPVALKDPKQVSADSLQSPHDPDVTYSGHKGKGYEVQVAETSHEENATQLITHVEVTPSSGSDTDVSVPVVDGLCDVDLKVRGGGPLLRASSPAPTPPPGSPVPFPGARLRRHCGPTHTPCRRRARPVGPSAPEAGTVEDSSSLDVRVREMPGWVITGLSFSDQGKTAVRTLSAVGQGALIGVIWVAILSPAWLVVGGGGYWLIRRYKGRRRSTSAGSSDVRESQGEQ